ncbi:MAG: Diaminopimelate epimerase [Legionellaceae bacterium]
MTALAFTKMHALGNDFMLINGITQKVKLTPHLIQQWGNRHFGVGFDQLLLVEPSYDPEIDFIYRIFNADGTEVGQCGNGARCLALFVQEQGLTHKKNIRIATKTTQMTLEILENEWVKVNMGLPFLAPEIIPFLIKQQAISYSIQTEMGLFTIGAVSMGNPHCILQVEDIHEIPIQQLSPLFQKHPQFPESVNVGFLQIVNRNTLKLRVYERGVGETLACGSGACAAVVYAKSQNWVDEKVTVELPGGQVLIEWHSLKEPVYLIGPASIVFHGVINKY